MKVAIPTWNERISPVFESAGTFVLLEVEDHQSKTRAEAHLTESLPPVKVRWLADHGVDILICGAISRPLSDLVVASGISIIPWVCGELDQVIEAFLADSLPNPELTMPGCCGHRIGGRGGGRRRGHGHGGGRGRGDGDGRGSGRGRGPRNPMRRKS